MKGTVVKVSYRVWEDGQLAVRILGRATDGSRIDRELLGTQPHFYLPAQDLVLAQGSPGIVSVEPGPLDTANRPTVRVNVRYPFEVPRIRLGFPLHFEADIIYSIRTRVDYRLTHIELPEGRDPIPVGLVRPIPDPLVAPRKLHLDIEVDDQFGFADPADPSNPVLSVGFFDTAKKAFGVIYNGPTVDPEKVRERIVEHLRRSKPDLEFPYPIRLFPVSTEGDVLGGFGELLAKADPDILSAWNGYTYDFPYLGGRAQRFLDVGTSNADIVRLRESVDPVDATSGRMGHEHRNRGRFALADPLEIAKKQDLRQRSFSLQNYATEELGFGKVEREESVASLRKTDPAKFLAYNLVDVFLLWQIDEKRELIAYFLEAANTASVELEDVIHNSRLIDGTLLAEARANGPPTIVLPSKDFAPHHTNRGRGAEVFPTTVGIFRGVLALDLSGSYPNLTRVFNISPETKVREESVLGTSTEPVYRLPTGGVYRRSPEGLVPRAIRRIQTIRNRAKGLTKTLAPDDPGRKRANLVSKALKHVLASFSGVAGSSDWRLGDIATYEDVTGMAREQLRWNRRHLEDPAWLGKVLGEWTKWEGRVVLGDTDSCYFTLTKNGEPVSDPDALIGYAKLLREALDASYLEFIGPYGATENLTTVDIEGVFEVLRTLPRAGSDTEVGAKKRYYGIYAFEGERDVRSLPFEKRVKYSGIELKRFNNAEITRDVETDVTESVLTLRPTGEIIGYLDTVHDDVLAGKRDEDLLIQAKWSDSTANQPHLRAMRNWARLSGRSVRRGDEFHWAYVSHVVSPNGEGDGDIREFAIPLDLSLETARTRGWTITLDREEMYRKTVSDPVRLVFPEVETGGVNLDSEW